MRDVSAASVDSIHVRLALGLMAGTLLVFLVAGVGIRGFGLYHWHDSQRALQLIVLAIIGITTAVWPALARTLLGQASATLHRPDALLLAAALLLGLASATQSESPRFALAEISLLALLALGICVVAASRAVEGPRFDRVALFMITLAAAALVAPFLVAWLAGMSTGVGLIPTFLFQSGFSNVRFLGQFHTLVLPLLACVVLLPGLRRGYRLIVFTLLVLTWVMAISTATRGTWFAWTIGVLLALPFARLHLLPLLKVQVAALAAGSLVSWLMFEVAPRYAVNPGDASVLHSFFGRFADPFALSLRDVLWTRALELIAQHPWLGVGPMMLALDHNTVASHPHNALLQLAAEWGVPAALALSLVGMRLWWGLAVSISRRSQAAPASPASGDQATSQLACALLWAISGAAVHSMVDGLLVMPYAQVLCVVTVGWALGIASTPTARLGRTPAALETYRADTPGTTIYFMVAAVVAAACVALAAGTLPEAVRLDAREHAYFELHPADVPRKPRLWAQGWLTEDVRHPARAEPGQPSAKPEPAPVPTVR